MFERLKAKYYIRESVKACQQYTYGNNEIYVKLVVDYKGANLYSLDLASDNMCGDSVAHQFNTTMCNTILAHVRKDLLSIELDLRAGFNPMKYVTDQCAYVREYATIRYRELKSD